ncbi:hypothetical protein evm_013923 [Chilo suppressalis]|nr:hypothetical protein evm_013923 [Chilo suppressalis]
MQSVFNVMFDNYQEYYLNLLDNLDDIERRTKMPRVFQLCRNYYEEYDEESFKTRFRLSKSSALDVLQLIEHQLEFPNDKNNSLSPINQLLLTLRFYATGCHQLTIGDFYGEDAMLKLSEIGKGSINVQAICNAQLLFTDLVVRWPGSSHDERIFSASRRHAMFESGIYGDAVLVADSGYMNRE